MEARNDLMGDNMRMFTSAANVTENDETFESSMREEF